MIIAGRITVNRQPAEIGQQVGPGDEVRVNGKEIPLRFARAQTRVLLYHKPAGEIVSRDDPDGRAEVFSRLPPVKGGKWISVGRLDLNSEGLLIFTTSGELANRMMHPRYEMEREYAVRVLGRIDEEQQQRLRDGIELEDGLARVKSIADGGGEGANHWYHIVLTEGRNHEVRRLMSELGLQVSRLIRTRFGPVAMPPQLKLGMRQELEGEELQKLLQATGMNAEASPGRPSKGGPQPQRHGQPKGRDRGARGRPQGNVADDEGRQRQPGRFPGEVEPGAQGRGGYGAGQRAGGQGPGGQGPGGRGRPGRPGQPGWKPQRGKPRPQRGGPAAGPLAGPGDAAGPVHPSQPQLEGGSAGGSAPEGGMPQAPQQAAGAEGQAGRPPFRRGRRGRRGRAGGRGGAGPDGASVQEQVGNERSAGNDRVGSEVGDTD
jgi:23S rRNA pseudouridine2605 synthase